MALHLRKIRLGRYATDKTKASHRRGALRSVEDSGPNMRESCPYDLPLNPKPQTVDPKPL